MYGLPEATLTALDAEFGQERVDANLDPERFLTEADLGGEADPAFPVWTASDAEAWDEWQDMQEAAMREVDLWN